jgi:hypothetical protein
MIPVVLSRLLPGPVGALASGALPGVGVLRTESDTTFLPRLSFTARRRGDHT